MKFTVLRVSLATVLLVAAGTSVRPHLTSYVSSSALVNAPVVSVSAPFNGVIEDESAAVARPVHAGDTLFVMENARGQRSELEALQAELGALSGEIAGVSKQVDDLDHLSEDLISRREAKIAARRAWFAPRLDEARWEIAKVEAHLTQARELHERLSTLSERGGARDLDVIEAQAQLSASEAELKRKQAVLRRLEIEQATLDGESGVDMASSDFEQIEYRIDEIAIRRADLDARLLGLQTRRAGLQTQIARASVESSRQETFSPISTIDGVIWNASSKEGASVSNGEQIVEVLDCSRRFLEVVLPERHFEKVPAGTKAWVKLKGASEAFTAEVAAAYGSGARPNRAMQAASPRIEMDGGVRVIVGIGKPDLSSYAVQRSFCDVGRAAEVRFETDGSAVSEVAARIAGWLGSQTSWLTADNSESQKPGEG